MWQSSPEEEEDVLVPEFDGVVFVEATTGGDVFIRFGPY
jgi:hypothetical protein